jgi:hypothetical protein
MGQHVLKWLVFAVVGWLLLPVLIPATDALARIQREIAQVQVLFGDEDAVQVVKRANVVFDRMVAGSGLLDGMQRLYVPEQQRRGNALPGDLISNLTGKTNGYLASAGTLLYGAFVRLFIMLAWLPYVLPFLAAAVMHGLVRRRIKLESFGLINPTLYALSSHALIGLFFLPLLYLIAPLPLPPLFVPIWALAAAAPLIFLLANIQRLR